MSWPRGVRVVGTSLVLCSLVAWSPSVNGPRAVVSKPPAELSHGGFYEKYAECRGFPVLASGSVSDEAVQVVVRTFENMLANVPESTVALLKREKFHYSIIGKDEQQTDLPEYRHLKNDPKMDWNKRARGLGGLPVASGGEENILELPGDRYVGESIFIHEFAHTMDEIFSLADPNRKARIRAAFEKAQAAGLWVNTYATSNPGEYYAEGVQSYFDCNRAADPPNGIHNAINTREALQQYDPALYAIVDQDFGANPWRYSGTYARSKPTTKPSNLLTP